MKELKIEELSVKQKLGMIMTALVSHYQEYDFEAELEYTLELIRNHSLGAVWVTPQIKNLPEVIIKEEPVIKEELDPNTIIGQALQEEENRKQESFKSKLRKKNE